MRSIAGRVCVVTGASKSIGLAVAQRLAKLGAKVALIDIDPNVITAAAQIEGEAVGFTLDITSQEHVVSCFERIRKELGPIYALINNAGVAAQTPIEDITAAEWERVMAVNVYGSFYCIQAALPDMKAAKEGKIVNFSSKSGKTGSAFMTSYSAAKGAIIAMTSAIAHEIAPFNINCNCICPGITDATGVWQFVSGGYTENLKLSREEVVAKFTGKVPLGRLAGIEDIVDYVKFLVISADYCTGQALNISGGREMH